MASYWSPTPTATPQQEPVRPEPSQSYWSPQAPAAPIERGYWTDPRNIAMHYNAIQADTQGLDWQSFGIDPGFVEAAYNYAKGLNSNKEWTEWTLPTTGDYFAELLNQQPAPPPESQWMSKDSTIDWTAILGDFAPPELLNPPQPGQPIQSAGAVPAFTYTPEQWAQLPSWQKTTATIQSSGVLYGLAATAPWAALAGVGALVAGGTLLPAVGLLGLGVGLGVAGSPDTYNKLRAKFGNQDWIGDLEGMGTKGLLALNWLAEKAEQTIGMAWQLGDAALSDDKDFQQLLNNIPQVWEASRLTYESLAPTPVGKEIGNLPAHIEWLSDMLTQGSTDVRFAEAGQVQTIGQLEPVSVPAAGLALLQMATAEQIANPGKSYQEIIGKYQEQYGFSGQLMDLIGQSLLDPLNAVPKVETGGLKLLGKVTGDTALVQAAKMADKYYGGASKTFQLYPEVLKGTTLEGAPTWMQRTLGGLTPTGEIDLARGGGLLGKVWPWYAHLNELQPEAQAKVGAVAVVDWMGSAVSNLNDVEFKSLIKSIETGSFENAVGAAKAMNTPTFATYKGLLNDFDWKIMRNMDATRALANEKLKGLRNIADRMGQDIEVLARKIGDGDADTMRAIERLMSQNPDLRGVNAAMIADYAKFFKENPWTLNDQHYRAHLHVQLDDHIAKALPKFFGVTESKAIDRVLSAAKGVQSLALLSFSPSYLVNNVATDMITRMYDGIGGWTSMREINAYFEKMGAVPARLREGLGQAAWDNVGGKHLETEFSKMKDEIRRVTRGKDLSQRVIDSTGAVNRTVGVFTKAAAAWEQADSARATYMAHRKTFPLAMEAAMEKVLTPADREILRSQGARIDEFMRDLQTAVNPKQQRRMFGDEVTRNVEKYANDVATQTTKGTADFMRESGIFDTLNERLERGETPEHAIIGLEEQLRTKLDEYLDKDLPRREMEVASRVMADPAVMGDVLYSIMDANMRMSVAQAVDMTMTWDNASALRGQAKSDYVKGKLSDADRSWRQHQKWVETTYAGLIRGNGGSPELMSTFGTQLGRINGEWGSFFENRTKQWADFWKRAKDYDTVKFWDEYGVVQKTLGKAYDTSSLREFEFTESMAQPFADMVAGKFGERTRPAAEQYMLDTAGAQEYLRRVMADFRAWERGEPDLIVLDEVRNFVGDTPPARKGEMWPRFYEEILMPAGTRATAEGQEAALRLLAAIDGRPPARDIQPAPELYRQLLERRRAEAVTNRQNQEAPAPVDPVKVQEPEVVKTPEPAAEPKPRTPWVGKERRKATLEARKRDPNTGAKLWTGVEGVQEAFYARYPVTASLDLKALKYTNDSISTRAGDAYIQAMVDQATELKLDIYRKRPGGDEFIIGFADEAAAKAGVEQLRNAMTNRIIRMWSDAEGKDVYRRGFDFNWGLGDNADAADASRNAFADSNPYDRTQPLPGTDVNIEPRAALAWMIDNALPQLDAAQRGANKALLDARARAWAALDPKRTIEQWYSESIAEIRRSPAAVEKMLKQKGAKAQDTRGAIEWLADGRAIIHMFEAADVSSFAHESFHLFERQLSDADLAIVAKEFGGDSEAFSNAGLKYLQEGVSPNFKLRDVFEKFKTWLTELWAHFKEQGKTDPAMTAKVSDEMRGVFDRLLSEHVEDTVGGWEGKVKFADQASKEILTGLGWTRGHKALLSAVNKDAGAGFKKWFGESKVVDEGGAPLTVYHATTEDFEAFDFSRLGELTRINTNDPEAIALAELGAWFSDHDVSEAMGVKRVYSANLSLKNPYSYDDGIWNLAKIVLDEGGPKEFIDNLKRLGHDGIIVSDEEFGGRSFIAFSPDQIKSAFEYRQYAALHDVPWDVANETIRSRVEAKAEPAAPIEAAQPPQFQQQPHDIAPGMSDALGINDFVYDYELNSEAIHAYMKPGINALFNSMLNDTGGGRYGFEFLNPQGQQIVRKLYQDSKQGLAQAHNVALNVSQAQRDFSLLNYDKRYNFDRVLTAYAPYQFWFTRTMQNWAMRSADRPGMLAFFARMANFMSQGQDDKLPIASRVRGKLRIPFPGLPEWAGGGVYVNPLAKVFPFMEMLRPFERIMQEQHSFENKAYDLLNDWIKTGDVNEDAGRQAQLNKSGPVWERALMAAQESEGGDALDYMSMFLSPALYISIPQKLLQGKPEEVGPFPPSRLAQALAAATGIQGFSKLDVEAAYKRGAGISQFGKWGDYYIDRQLANMAADGVITARDASTAMIERSGEAFDQAVQRVQFETMLKTPGISTLYQGVQALKGEGNLADVIGSALFSWLPADLLPTGELELRGLKEEYSAAWDAWHAGNKQALDTFFKEHPEYEARIALFKEPEERLHGMLTNEVWDRYTSSTTLDKRAIRDQLGPDFEMFLSGDDELIDSDTLAMWAQQLGGEAPVPPGQEVIEAPPLEMPPMNDAQAVQMYYQQREQLFPGLAATMSYGYELPEAERKKLFRDLPWTEYNAWKDDYFAAFPQTEQYVTDTDAEKNQQAAIQGYMEKYPGFGFSLSAAQLGRALTIGEMRFARYVWEQIGRPGEGFYAWAESLGMRVE
jgi:hypothetical protein